MQILIISFVGGEVSLKEGVVKGVMVQCLVVSGLLLLLFEVTLWDLLVAALNLHIIQKNSTTNTVESTYIALGQSDIYLFMMIKTLLIVCATLFLVHGKPNSAPYIHQAGRPLNIAHRGLCSILPENTLQSFSAAMYQGADFIELDVVYTKEKQLLVMHDPFLTRITNIKSKPEFATRYETRTYNGAKKTDWWTDQFTVTQLKTLGIKQAQAPGRLTIFDYQFTFPLLSELIEMVIAFNKQHNGKRNPDGRLVGILIEAKDSQMYRDLYGIEIGKDILDLLKKYNIQTIEKSAKLAPIYLHSFDLGTVKYWGLNTELPNNFLIYKGESFDLNDINTYATGIGFEEGVLWDYSSSQPTQTFYKARELGLLLHIWTFKDDVLFFNATTNINMYSIGHHTLKLDGIITEFADIYAPLAQIWKNATNTHTKPSALTKQSQVR